MIEINTVDAFQGREKQVILFNCVRSNNSSSLQGSLGFLMDERRLNVAITRPQHFLVIVGNAATLMKSHVWSNLIAHCKETDCLLEVPAEILRNHEERTAEEPELITAAIANMRQSDQATSAAAGAQKLFADDAATHEVARDLLRLANTAEER